MSRVKIQHGGVFYFIKLAKFWLKNLTTIHPVVSEIICLIKINTDDCQTDRKNETGDHFFVV